jgi:hypothetical protein
MAQYEAMLAALVDGLIGVHEGIEKPAAAEADMLVKRLEQLVRGSFDVYVDKKRAGALRVIADAANAEKQRRQQQKEQQRALAHLKSHIKRVIAEAVLLDSKHNEQARGVVHCCESRITRQPRHKDESSAVELVLIDDSSSVNEMDDSIAFKMRDFNELRRRVDEELAAHSKLYRRNVKSAIELALVD